MMKTKFRISIFQFQRSVNVYFILNLIMSEKERLLDATRTVAIIPAAGSGVRMGNGRAKQFLNIDGKPLLAATLRPFELCRSIDAVIIVVPSSDLDYCRKEIVEKFKFEKVKLVVAGGNTRQDSVRLGLEAAGHNYDLALIHDGVRPVISENFIESLIEAAKTNGAVISGLPAKETVKEVDNGDKVVGTYDRSRIWLVQTPQVFRYKEILAAHIKAFEESWEEATDDSALIERVGIPVTVVEGSEQNIKVTTPNDLELARYFLKMEFI